MNERWGQHVGALAHLLALGTLAAQGWEVEAEPSFGRQSPDVLASRDVRGEGPDDGARPARRCRLLVEVRAVSGAGNFPWELRRASGRGLDAETGEKLREAVAGVVLRKAETYAPLVGRLEIPYVVCLYEDKDDVLAGVVDGLLRGRGPGPAGDARPDAAAVPGPGDPRLAHVSAVLVLRRIDTDSGELLLEGDLFDNPDASRPLPVEAAFPLLRRHAAAGRDAGRGPGPFRLPSGDAGLSA